MYNAQQHSDYIISDYMDKIATRINILETELKFAWRALDLMSSEYGKMWARLEKLENISMEQKSVVANLMGLYGATNAGGAADGSPYNMMATETELEQQQLNYAKALQQQQLQLQQRHFELLKQQEMHASNVKIPSAAEFNEMLGELKNEALNPVDANDMYNYLQRSGVGSGAGDGSSGAGGININADLRQLQDQQKQIEQSIQHNDELFEELNALSYAQQQNAAVAAGVASHSLRDFLASANIKDGLEEGIDLVQRERMKQRYSSGGQGMELFRNLIQMDENNKQNQSEVDFFRSGEINRDLYSSQAMAAAAAVATALGNETDGVVANMIGVELLAAAAAANPNIILPHESLLIDHMGASRPVSSLGMIYEDNEEQEPEHQSSASEVDELLMYDHQLKSESKSRKKKQHKQHEMELLKSAMSSVGSQEHEDVVEKEEPKPASPPPPLMTKEETIAFIIDEIGKIEDLSLFTSEQINSLQEVIEKEFVFFNRINHKNKHLLLILLNPISSTDDNYYESTQHKCDEIKKKLHKNMEIMKTVLDDSSDLMIDIKPREAIDIDEILETSSSIMDDDDMTATSNYNKRSNDSMNRIKSRFGGSATSASASAVVGDTTDYYSQNLLRNNSNLNEQLKILDNKENEIMCKKSLKSITDELEASERKNLLDNFDEQTIIGDHYGDPFDVGRTQSLSQLAIRNDSHQYSSNSSIYSNDEYIKSLKKSLERHNSMLFLLHLQNSNYQSGNDIRSDASSTGGPAGTSGGSGVGGLDASAKKPGDATIQMIDDERMSSSSQSPPPPAPNGEDSSESIVFNLQQISSMNPFHADIMMMSNEMNKKRHGRQTANIDASPYQHMQYLSSSAIISGGGGSGASNTNLMIESSPKKTKSDSGLSSMSGFSSLEKSPNTATAMASNCMIAGAGVDASGKEAADCMFSEENLNYIRELSKNVPICSVFESKSIFNNQMQSTSQHYPQAAAPPLPMHQSNVRNYPDLVGHSNRAADDEELRNFRGSASNIAAHHYNSSNRKSGGQASYHDLVHEPVHFVSETNEKTTANEAAALAHRKLTDRLVFYPSSNNITDYNSSMNLNYMGYNSHPHIVMDKNGQIVHRPQPTMPDYGAQMAEHGSAFADTSTDNDAASKQHQSPHHQHSYYVRQSSATNVRELSQMATNGRTYNRSTSVPVRQSFYIQDGVAIDPAQMQAAAAGDHNLYIVNQSGYVTIANERMQQSTAATHHQMKGTQQMSHSQNHKYLNKFSQWLPDLKLKKITKRYRSYSLPAGIESDEELMMMTPPPASAPVPGGHRHTSNQQQFMPQQRKHLSSSASTSASGSPTSRSGSMKKMKMKIGRMLSRVKDRDDSPNHMKASRSSSCSAAPVNYGGGSGSAGEQFYQNNSMQQAAAQQRMPQQRFIMKARTQPSHSQSDTETDLYSGSGGFVSDTEDKSAASDSFVTEQCFEDYFGAPPASNQANLFATMESKGSAKNQERDDGDRMQRQPSVKQSGHDISAASADKEYLNPNLLFQTIGDAKQTATTTATPSNTTQSQHNHSGSELSSSSTNGGTGDKQSAATSVDPNANHETGDKFIFSSTSMEFAVSRKIAKYRQKNVSSDDINGQKQASIDSGKNQITGSGSSGGSGIDEDINLNKTTPNVMQQQQQQLQQPQQHHLQKTHSIFVEDEMLGNQEYVQAPESGARQFGSHHHAPPPVANERFKTNFNFHAQSGQPQLQQQHTLDIPARDDEDNKSQHSYRTISSSRRQSTEDSIDTDDEYFCYELRKLEELERRSHLDGGTTEMVKSFSFLSTKSNVKRWQMLVYWKSSVEKLLFNFEPTTNNGIFTFFLAIESIRCKQFDKCGRL